ncbi:oxygenase MpaB family protein [Actinomadura rugatobispora]|uniref:Oxygenase MpaB family protein n=1 Tax=Actinomadura rugatobispora TaxID=1994 RepID=A0ABW1AI43_9ACTN|nr:oxygenase MpaB family protein [Actinomadura rugatobispora]
MTGLGPGSLTWRFFGDTRMALVGPRAAVLQNMLPALGQGVLDHSVFFDETFARVKRSAGPILNTVYGGAEANRTGMKVRDYHTGIKGTMPDGTRYHALDPDTYYWAHATFLDTMLYCVETFIRPLSEAEKRRVYEESKTWYRMYGVSDRVMPEDWESFQAYWKRMLDEEIVAHKTARYGVGYVFKGLPRPKQVPAPVWRAVSPPLNSVARFVTVGGLHPRMRELLGTPWSAADERRYRRFAAAVRGLNRVWPLLPEAVRYVPQARRAFARERRRGGR